MKRLTTIDFINKANSIHNSKYLYSKTKYINNKSKVIITCSIHGDFEQTPHSHLVQKSGCTKCTTTCKNDIEELLQKAESAGFVYISHTALNNILLKDKFGVYKTTIGRLRNNSYPTIKTAIDKTSTFKNIIKEKYPNLVLDSVIYKNTRTSCIFTCKIHGNFITSPNRLLQSTGCPECSKQFLGFKKSTFINNCKNNKGILYILLCYDEKETFIKIGITSKSVKQRYKNKTEMPYNYKIILELKHNPSYIYDLETFLKEKLKINRYNPNKPFDGAKTECFKLT